MQNTESNTPQSGRDRCSRCSKKAINSCAGCLGAPGYGNGQLAQRTLYCGKECQKAHWSTHKAECRVFQTRRHLHRAAAVLEAVIEVLDAKSDKAVMRLGIFVTELFIEIDVEIEEVAVVSAGETTLSLPKTHHVFKITLSNSETWVIDPNRAFPPSPWADYIRAGRLDVRGEKALGSQHRAEGVFDPVTMALQHRTAGMVAARGGKLGFFLKGSESTFQNEMKRLMEDVKRVTTTTTTNTAAAQGSDNSDDRDPTRGENPPCATPPISVATTTTTTRLYKIQPLPGKGQGVVAACLIRKGTRVLSEAPLLKMAGNPRDETGARLLNQIITRQLDELDKNNNNNKSQQASQRFYALHNNYNNNAAELFPPAVGIAKTNALPLGHNTREAGIFLEASRINHSCRNNAENTWSPSRGELTIHAVRDVAAGEEITISYVGGFLGYDARQARLYAAFGFRCVCERCAVTSVERKQSDERLRRLAALEEEIGDGVGIVATPLACLRKTREMLRLLRDEGLGDGAAIPRVYYDALQVAVANGDLARARVFAERWYESRAVVEGEDSEDAVRAKGLMERPEGHRLYGTSMKWKQSVRKVPRGMGEEAFENWLWREKGDA